MSGLTFAARGVVAVALSLVAVTASAQAVADTQKPFEPVSGQAGKDVVWVPTPQATVDKMLDLAKVTPQDYVIDLGSGNGVTVITAAKRGATALGVEFNPEMVKLARRLASEAGVADKATFVEGDLFEADLSKATVITLFLLPDINEKLRPKLLDLKPGTRLVSHAFSMGDWTPEQKETLAPRYDVYLWIVPAKVEGHWTVQRGEKTFTVDLKQKYQQFEGTAQIDGKPVPVTNGRLHGKGITFDIKVDNQFGTFRGEVDGDAIKGAGGWQAKRA